MITLPNTIPCNVTTGGIDTAHIGLYVCWKKEYKDHLETIFETQKKFKAARKDSDELPQFAIEQYFSRFAHTGIIRGIANIAISRLCLKQGASACVS